mmetsp:Transcript_104817/g.146116  ORF Transcript_104817/g.146116 Transcript_104817/m.146116 type:complete len:234 (+) Transcript_104817:76-777(+)
MHPSLTRQEPSRRGRVARSHVNPVVPCSRMDVDPFPLGYMESSHVLWLDIVSSRCWAEAHREWHRCPWPKKLTTIWVVVTHPQVYAACVCRLVCHCVLGQRSQAIQVLVVRCCNGQILAIEIITLPFHLEVAFRCACLIASTRIQRAPARLGPLGDLKSFCIHCEILWSMNQPAQTCEGSICSNLPGNLPNAKTCWQSRTLKVLRVEHKRLGLTALRSHAGRTTHKFVSLSHV